MPEAVYHQMIMLRPMQAGISGYARVQGEAGRQLVQINLRGVQGGMRAFWYAGDGLVKELGSSDANPRGEAGLYTDLPAETIAPRRLTALLIADTGEKPRPLAIGLCTAQSAGSLMDAKSALLALCDKLGREGEKAAAAAPEEEACRAWNGAAEAAASKPAASGQGPAPADGAKAGEASEKHSVKASAAGETQAGKQRDAAAEPGKAALPAADRKAIAGVKEASVPSGCGNAPALPQTTKAANPAAARRRGSADQPPPREVFLPAIDVCRERRRRKQPESSANAAREQAEACSGQESSLSGTDTGAGACSAGCAANDRRGSTASAPFSNDASAAGKLPESSPAEGTPPSSVPPLRSPSGRPADRLPPLFWPEALRSVAFCLDRCPPVPLMGWPGWRFVQVQKGQNGLWIGCERKAGSISRVAYVLPADAEAPEGKPFRQARTAAGDPVQVLVTGG